MAAPTIVQSVSGEGANPATTQANSVSATFASKATAKNTIVVFRTCSDFAGVHNDLTASDVEGNQFFFVGQANSSPAGGAQTIGTHFASNIIGDSTTGDVVTGGFSLNGDVEDFQSLYIIEVGNAHPSPLVGHSENPQNGLAVGTNNVTSGSITVTAAQVPCIMLAASMNSSGNGTVNGPTVGTGMTLLANAWAFQSGTPITTFAYQNITTAGTYAAIFNQSSTAAEDIVTVAIILMGTQAQLLCLKLTG